MHERRTENAVLRDVHADGDTRREDEQEPGPSSRARVSAVEEQFLVRSLSHTHTHADVGNAGWGNADGIRRPR